MRVGVCVCACWLEWGGGFNDLLRVGAGAKFDGKTGLGADSLSPIRYIQSQTFTERQR